MWSDSRDSLNGSEMIAVYKFRSTHLVCFVLSLNLRFDLTIFLSIYHPNLLYIGSHGF